MSLHVSVDSQSALRGPMLSAYAVHREQHNLLVGMAI